MPEASIGREGVSESLRKELEHSIFTSEKYLHDGVDAHFYGRKGALDYVESKATPSDYWTQQVFVTPWTGYFTSPATLNGVSVYTKRAFKYPQLNAYAILPSLVGYPAGSSLCIGFEDGSYGNIAAFYWSTTGVLETMSVVLGAMRGTWRYLNITALLPADAKTARHRYRVELNRAMAVFYIDDSAVAYGLMCPNSAFASISPPPYGLLSIENRFPAATTAFLEVNGVGNELKFDVPPYYFRVTDGDPLPPRVLRLYEAGTSNLFAGKAVAAGTLTSHAIPVFGYSNKTLYFRANQAGTLSIEVLTQAGNWRTYESDTVSVNELWWYKMTGDVVLARLAYMPTTYPATVSEGEVNLNE